MLKRKGRVVTLLALFLISVTAMAHRYHVAISSVERDAQSGAIEIEHRLFMHDFEPILQQIGSETVDFDTAEGEALIRRYIESHFTILDSENKPLELQWVGVEMDQTYATVYQELSGVPPLKQLQFRHQLLSEIPQQVNTLNLVDGAEHTSLVFSDKSATLRWTP